MPAAVGRRVTIIATTIPSDCDLLKLKKTLFDVFDLSVGVWIDGLLCTRLEGFNLSDLCSNDFPVDHSMVKSPQLYEICGRLWSCNCYMSNGPHK